MRTIKVQGKGKVSADPEITILKFKVMHTSKRYEEALRHMNAGFEGLVQDLKAAGLAREQLKTRDFDVRAITRYGDGDRNFEGYQASHEIVLEFPFEKNLLADVLNRIAKGNSGAEIDIGFTVRDKEAFQKKALSLAVVSARDKADVLAKSAGVELGPLQHIEYGWSEIHIYEESGSMLCEAQGPANFDPHIQPEDVTAEENVTLVFEIRD